MKENIGIGIFFLFLLSLMVWFGYFLFTLKPKPDLYINGKPFQIVNTCIKSHEESKFGYHYGWSMMNNSYCYHFGSYTETICDKSKIDTLEIK